MARPKLTQARGVPRVVAERTGVESAAKRQTAFDKTRPRGHLLIKHPSIDPAMITKFIGIAPSHASRVGEPRQTPKGTSLPGCYRETSWTLRFENVDNKTVTELLETAILTLPTESELWPLLRKDGGKAWLIVAIVGTKYQGDELRAELMGRLAEMGIGLGIEVYAVPQN